MKKKIEGKLREAGEIDSVFVSTFVAFRVNSKPLELTLSIFDSEN